MKIKFGLILDNACRLAGRDPVLQGVPDSWRVTSAFAVNAGLRRLYSEKLPMFQRIELRRYRPSWRPDAGWQVGNECYFAATDHYYRLIKGPGSSSPALGEGASGWKVLEMNEVAALIEFNQPWETVDIDPAGCDKNAFAFLADPKYHPETPAIGGLGWFGHGVVLPSPAPTSVWVKFMPKAPRISFDLYNGGSAYSEGSVAMVDGDCYRARVDVAPGGELPSSSPSWQRVRLDEDFEEYLTRLASAALLTEDQGKYQTQAMAESCFNELVDRLGPGAGDNRMRVGRFRR